MPNLPGIVSQFAWFACESYVLTFASLSIEDSIIIGIKMLVIESTTPKTIEISAQF